MFPKTTRNNSEKNRAMYTAWNLGGEKKYFPKMINIHYQLLRIFFTFK